MGSSSNILIVDDNPHNLEALAAILKRDGYKVRPALSGELALRAAHSLAPDLVLLDVRMPGIGGIEAARRITAAHPETVVVLISIEDSDEFAEDAYASGAVALVRKQDFGPALLRRIWDAHGARV